MDTSGGSAGRRRAAAGLAVLFAVLLLPAAAPPDDPLVAQQAHLDRVGTFQAWDVRRGEGAVVAVLDTGVDLDHPDLAGRLVEGIDLVEPDTPPDDPQGHGTIVAGVIAAVAGNGRGVSGVAPQAMVMPIRVLDAQGRGTSDVVAEGIRHAIEQQVQVINLSLAEVSEDTEDAPDLLDVSLVRDEAVVTAIRDAVDAGIMVVAAAGNDGRTSTPYDADVPVVVVGATTMEDTVWEESNIDDRTLFAPGVGILSTWSEQRYARSDGTSFATPIVAAGAAMLLGAGLDLETATQRLVDTAVEIPGARGLGRVDLAAAVQGLQVAPPPPPPPPPPTDQPPPAPPPPPPTGPTGTPSEGAGPLEVAEPVQEVVVPTVPPSVVTEPPPPIATEPQPTVAPGPTPPATAADPEPVQAVAAPTATPTADDPAAGSGTPDGDAQRSAAMTLASMVLGVDVLLAGWVLTRRR